MLSQYRSIIHKFLNFMKHCQFFVYNKPKDIFRKRISMSSKPSINLKQSQSQQQKLAMTQTMQQAIQILHYSTSDLVDFLQEQSLENPLISVTIGSYSSEPFLSTVLRRSSPGIFGTVTCGKNILI